MSASSQRWTPEREAALARLWSAGASASYVGREVGASRNAVVAKAKRLGLRFVPQHNSITQSTAITIPDAPRPGGSFWRDGQADFRTSVLSNFGHRCCVTGVRELSALEAAHIIPHAAGGGFEIANGLSLRSDIHRLFDAGLLTVEPDGLTARLSRRVRCAAYAALDGNSITAAVRAPPDRDALRWHQRNVFKP